MDVLSSAQQMLGQYSCDNRAAPFRPLFLFCLCSGPWYFSLMFAYVVLYKACIRLNLTFEQLEPIVSSHLFSQIKAAQPSSSVVGAQRVPQLISAGCYTQTLQSTDIGICLSRMICVSEYGTSNV